MFIATERTPNPEAMKFLPDRRLTDGDSRSFEPGGFDPAASPLAARLFGIDGVRRVYIAPEFLTVSRAPDGPGWDQLRYGVIAALADHLESGEAALTADAGAGASVDADDVEGEIRQVLGLYVRPGVARDGGEVLFDRFDAETGVLWIRMLGACGGCPSSRLTLKSSVERIVRRYVPEVLRVEQTKPAAPAEPEPSRIRRWLSGFSGQTAGDRPKTVFSHSGAAVRKGEAQDPAGPAR